MISFDKKKLNTHHSLGMVATAKNGESPGVSSKATFFIIDDTTITHEISDL